MWDPRKVSTSDAHQIHASSSSQGEPGSLGGCHPNFHLNSNTNLHREYHYPINSAKSLIFRYILYTKCIKYPDKKILSNFVPGALVWEQAGLLNGAPVAFFKTQTFYDPVLKWPSVKRTRCRKMPGTFFSFARICLLWSSGRDGRGNFQKGSVSSELLRAFHEKNCALSLMPRVEFHFEPLLSQNLIQWRGEAPLLVSPSLQKVCAEER